jgi:hypothetical protein
LRRHAAFVVVLREGNGRDTYLVNAGLERRRKTRREKAGYQGISHIEWSREERKGWAP